jgi:hypothetical protein
MSRTPSPADAAIGAARAELPDTEVASFDRLVAAVTSTRDAPLSVALRAPLPGTTGIRWLRQEGLPPTTRAVALTPAQWLSLYRYGVAAGRAPGRHGPSGRQGGGRPSGAHGHAPGAQAAPRWF